MDLRVLRERRLPERFAEDVVVEAGSCGPAWDGLAWDELVWGTLITRPS